MTENSHGNGRPINSNNNTISGEAEERYPSEAANRSSQVSRLLFEHPRANWDQIVAEGDRKRQDYFESKKDQNLETRFIGTEKDYLKQQVFPELLPTMEATLTKAKVWNALKDPKCFFNGLDHIAQELWNNNPRHPERRDKNMHIFNMPWARDILKEKPRECYPKSWLWPKEHAAKVLQTHWRQYLVQRDQRVEEMRDFWRKLKLEKDNPNMASNPLLMKKFASSRELHDPRHPDSL